MSRSRHELLLEWVSERGDGSWSDFKRAFDWLFARRDDPAAHAWRAARDLAALGHLEIAWGREVRWTAAPPVLTLLPRSGGRALLTGARTRELTRAAEETAERLDLYLHRQPQRHGPPTMMVLCSSHEDAEQLALELDIPYTYSVANQLAAMLPPLQSWIELAEPRPLASGLDIERFEPLQLCWRYVAEPEGPGLYRCRTWSGHEYALWNAVGGWHQVVPEVGVYETLRWEGVNVLHYDQSSGVLTMPAEAALPPLHARAATLASGVLASMCRRKGLTWTNHWNIPASVAEGIASSLGQALIEGEKNGGSGLERCTGGDRHRSH